MSGTSGMSTAEQERSWDHLLLVAGVFLVQFVHYSYRILNRRHKVTHKELTVLLPALRTGVTHWDSSHTVTVMEVTVCTGHRRTLAQMAA